MKKFKKILTCVMSIGMLGSLTLVPINASALINEYSNDELLQYYQENAITEAIIVLENAEEYSGTYYFINSLEETPSINIDLQDTIYGIHIKKIDDTIDTSNMETILTFDYNNKDEDYFDEYGLFIPFINEYGKYDTLRFNTLSGWFNLDNTNIGDSDATIGESNQTILRGDVNLDGKVNSLDLLYLKKYLLGLIEW